MLLCLDVGNTDVFGGLFRGDKIVLRFRHPTKDVKTLGAAMIRALRGKKISGVAVCSVAHGATEDVMKAARRAFKTEPFLMKPGEGLKIKYKNPLQLGTDRIATALGALDAFPRKNIIVVDMGTAVTFAGVSAKKEFLGGLIMPGMRTALDALVGRVPHLANLEIAAQKKLLGRTTEENLKRGIFFGYKGAVKDIIAGLQREVFAGKKTVVVGTGGFSRLFADEKIFDAILPDLILHGIRIAHRQAG